MSARANALRLQVETALAGRVASPFEYRERRVETVPAGVPEIDRLTGGLPRGALTEICGPAGSGRTSVLMGAMTARMEASEVCALVDARDAFDPQSAAEAGVRLGQLLWVRCRNVDQALRAADLLIQGGGFGLIALDLGDTPARVARAIPLPVWFRMRRAVENTPTILVALELDSNAKTCASLVLRMEARTARWTQTRDIFSGDGEGDCEREADGDPRRTVSKFADEIGENPHSSRTALRMRHPKQQNQGKNLCAENDGTGNGVPKSPPPSRRASSKTEGGVPEKAQRKAPRSEDEHGAPERAKPTLIKLASTGSSTCERDGRICLPYAQGCLFGGARNYAEVVRSRAKREGDRIVWRDEKPDGSELETGAQHANTSRG
jgi:recombination protein RecA